MSISEPPNSLWKEETQQKGPEALGEVDPVKQDIQNAIGGFRRKEAALFGAI